MIIKIDLPFHSVSGYSTCDGKPCTVILSGEAIRKIAEYAKDKDLVNICWQAMQKNGKPKYQIYIERKEE